MDFEGQIKNLGQIKEGDVLVVTADQYITDEMRYHISDQFKRLVITPGVKLVICDKGTDINKITEAVNAN
jgi:hypothetical protein